MPLSSLPFPPKIHSFCCPLPLYMEDSPPVSLPRLRKNPTFTTTATNPSRKLNLFCSFNGAFRFSLSPPHSDNKLKYIGGETRIVSIDRSITLSRLRCKISDLCPKLRPFSLKYQLLVSGRVADPESRLVSLDSDRSLRRMVEEYEKPEMYGKLARLWIFVVRDDSCVSDVNCDVGDESKRKMVLKERFFKTGLERIRLSGLDSYNSETKREYYHPLIDLGSEQQTVLDHRLGDVSFEGRENFGSLVQHSVHSSRPLNRRDGNLQAKRNGVLHCSSGQNAQTFGSGTRSAVGNLSNLRESGVIPLISSKQNSCNVGEECLSKLNRENVMPWGPMSDSRSRRNQWDGNAFCHKPSENNVRDQQIKPYQIHNHASNQTNTGNNGSVRLGGKHSGRTCYLGFRPNASISKQGQFIRSYCSDYWEPGFAENPVERRLRMRNSGNNKDRSNIALSGEQNGLVVSHNGNLATSECHLSYHDAGSPVAENCFSACNFIDTPSCYVGTVETQQHLLTGSLCNDYQQLPIDCGPSIFGQQRVPGSSGLSSNLGLRNLECDNKFMDTGEDCNLLNQSKNEHHYPQAEISSSVDLLKKQSLVSSKEVEPAVLYSVANINASNAFLKPESKHLDVMKVVDKFSIGPGADESTIYASSPSCQKVHEEEEIQQDPPSGLCIHENDDTKGSIECSTAIGGISSDLAAFYSSLATRELQTIKSSDLECIKELGSGTYGSVYYGKWKGTDVAVKKIKASCFAEGSLEDRLIADFWKEAHILGQLHHPNIVALYGVVTDGPVNNLATVTEYMVNGSLKQVLRRKDRTIDRRKRLILAMDAAFGMEYLHGKNIVHFDLKSHNLLVNMRDPWRPVCKIGDLGLSKIKQRTLVSGGVRGTIPWMAPELLRNSMVTEKVDVYSFGIVMWELLTGEEPYADMRSEEIIVGIIKGTLRPEIPCWCDQVWRSLMERCWSSDPDARPTFSEIVEELRAMSAELNIC